MKINKKPIRYISAAFFLTCLSLYLFVNEAGSVPAQSDEKTAVQKVDSGAEIAGSIVRTNEPHKAINYAKKNDLKPSSLDVAPDSTKLVTLDEAPSNPKVRALEKNLNVEIEPNYVYRAFFTPDDPNYSNQWNLSKISAPAAWDIGRGSSDVTVAVIDTGVLFEQTINSTTYSQPDFPTSRQWENPGETGMTQAGDSCWGGAPEDKKTNDCDDDGNEFIDDWRGWDFMGGFRGSGAGCPNNGDPPTYESPGDSTFVTQDNDPQPYSCDSPSSPSTLNKNHYNGTCVAWVSACYVGHGTMVASTAAATTDNGQLIAGIDHNTKIMGLRVIDGYGYSTSARIASAINYAAEKGADVINMSLGMSCDNESFTDPVMEDAIDAARAADTLLVAASGNDGWNSVCYPASSPHVMAVGATNQSDQRISYSNYSRKLDVVAPSGVPVANAPSAFINNNYYGSAGGTSLSTPHVAGLAALLKGNDPSLSRTRLTNLIRFRADKVAGMGGNMYHQQYGYGRINLYVTLAATDGKLPIYRLFRGNTVSHFYTKDPRERDKAVTRLGYRYEGIGFWSLATTSGTVPIYRLFKPATVSHFYTKSASERDKAVSKLGYRYESIGFRMPSSGAIPIYRLFKPATVSHFYTKSASERDKAVSKLGYRYESVGFKSY